MNNRNAKWREVATDKAEAAPSTIMGSVVSAPAPQNEQPNAQPEPCENLEVSAEEEAQFASYAEIMAEAKPVDKRSTSTETFVCKGKRRRFEIYTDGREDAERWSRLSSAMMEGYSHQAAAKLTGKSYEGMTVTAPVGNGIKRIVVKDPAYIGLVRVFTLVSKNPSWSMTEALIMGNELGQGFVDVCEWAARENGVTESLLRQRDEMEKNAASLGQSTS